MPSLFPFSFRVFPVVAVLLSACAAAPVSTINSFEECAAAGYPIMESYPEQCRTPDGRLFVRDVEPVEPPEGGPAADPVSLAALMQKTFSGSDLVLGDVLADTATYTRYTITYKSGDLRISGILNIPKGDGPFPLLILNHGHIDTSIYTNGRGLKREQDYLARNGYAVLHTDYRNHAFSDKDESNEANMRLGYAEDAINAVLAVRAANLPQIDAERVGMLGHSMGGGVTLNTLVIDPDLVDAAVLFAPVSGDARLNYERWTLKSPQRAAEVQEAHGSPEENPEFWDGISALTYIDRIQTPVMIHHGTADDSVPLAWSDDLDTRLQAAGKDVLYHVYQDEPHEFIADWSLVMQRTKDFFDAHLAIREQE